ncbi:hypothetical protein BST81_22910 [Leptolyngbya sp. 'hensonii']|uniref:hypothetical protein n=1 Tax=Leptolyngbya sp. 'hensonii' TaxID=1922337 RepID=UPI00094F54AC|nr:hypothetical protein [Leptolyngbya sp. 'hensonii']OLP16081.1 hypothetical protein BST81_22910 [Leptolyngbya sp. 'hensonii']
MLIQLCWTNLETGEERRSVLQTPIALGSDPDRMPADIAGTPVSKLTLAGSQVLGFHALIESQHDQLTISAQTPAAELSINSAPAIEGTLELEDYLQIGAYQIQLQPAPQGAQAGWECDRMVGFLIRKRCGRTTTVDCPNCSRGYQNDDPYYYDHVYYPHYGYYHGYWGGEYYDNRARYDYDPTTGNVDFTEADAAMLGNEADMDFEQDMGAS